MSLLRAHKLERDGRKKDRLKFILHVKASVGEDEEILFVDGVHPTHNVKVGYGWILKGDTKQVMSNTGESILMVPIIHGIMIWSLERRRLLTLNQRQC